MKTLAAIRSGPIQGVALLEVMLCSFLLASGLVAVLSMQTLALGNAQTSGHLLRAEWLLNDMLERMKANPSGFIATLAAEPNGRVRGHCESISGCTAEELAAHDLARWHQRLAELLPGGYGEIRPATLPGFPLAARLYQVRVRWQGNDQDYGFASAPDSSGMVAL